MDLVINENSVVTMHFSIKLADGSVADSTKVNGKPGTVRMGDGTLSPYFEQQLYGLKTLDKKTIQLKAEDAFGLANPSNIYTLSKQQFNNSPLEVGLIIEFTLPSGERIPGIIRAINEETVQVDFNNPLAGQNVTIDVEILEISNNQ